MVPASFKDMLGQRFTRLLVVSRAGSDRNGNALWNCDCDCGKKTVSHGFSLRNGAAKSCGCLTGEQLAARNRTHEKSGCPEYMVWAHMLQRCNNPNTAFYHRYGGRGIAVCDRWAVFEKFYKDMGARPTPNHTIERKNRNGNYEPDNCCWATTKEQNNNKCNNHYVEYQGREMSLTTAIETAGSGISLGAVRGRLARGWTLEQAVETPPNPNIYNWRRGY